MLSLLFARNSSAECEFFVVGLFLCAGRAGNRVFRILWRQHFWSQSEYKQDWHLKELTFEWVCVSVCVHIHVCACVRTHACITVCICAFNSCLNKNIIRTGKTENKPSSAILLSSWLYFYFLLGLWWHSAQRDWLSFFPLRLPILPSPTTTFWNSCWRSGPMDHAATSKPSQTSLMPSSLLRWWYVWLLRLCPSDLTLCPSILRPSPNCLHACQCSGSVYEYWGSVHRFCQCSGSVLSISIDSDTCTSVLRLCPSLRMCLSILRLYDSIEAIRYLQLQIWLCLSVLRFCPSILRLCLRLSISIEAIHL